MSDLPPTKKIRLLATSNDEMEERQEETQVEINKTVFEWDAKKVELFVFGYVREQIQSAIPDISSIIHYYVKDMLFDYHINNTKYSNIKYLSNDNIICDFRIMHDLIPNKFGMSTIIFTPSISSINNKSIIHRMHIKMIQNDCIWCSWNYSCNVGIIVLPDNNNDFKTIQNVIGKDDDLSLKFVNGLDKYDRYILDYFKMCHTEWNRVIFIEGERGSNVVKMCRSSCKKKKKIDVTVNLEYDIQCDNYGLWWTSDGNYYPGSDTKKVEYKDSFKIKLNLNNKKVLFGLSSSRCGCNTNFNKNGFEYEVCFSSETFE